MLGPVVNSVLVVVGTFVGIALKKIINERMQDSIVKALGLVVVYIAITSLFDEVSTINVLISMAIGAFIGEALDLEGKVKKLGDYLQDKLAKGQSEFSAGFVQATLLFCVGSMSILGAIQSGLMHDHNTLIVKGIIDGIIAIFFASKNGIGVAFSAISLFIYQGSIALLAGLLSPIITTYPDCINHINVVGGMILMAVGANMLQVGSFKPMNYVPAVVITVILTILF